MSSLLRRGRGKHQAPSSPLSAKVPVNTSSIPFDLLARIREFPLFNSAPDVFLVAITSKLRLQHVNPQEYIITEGEESKAMYWILRGTVCITSRDGEAIYAELSQGAFFGEIGILFDRPRTATVVARTRCMLVILTAEALNRILPSFPQIERAIRDEAQERLAIIEKRRHRGRLILSNTYDGRIVEANSRVRDFLIQVPLFASLPGIIIHKLALSVDPKSYAPFEYIIKQNSIGKDIYFVTSGVVEVVDEMSGKVKAKLSEGTYFGEIAFLLSTPRRTASIRCVTMVECLVLKGDTLDLLCNEYPEIMTQIEAMAKSRINVIKATENSTMNCDTPITLDLSSQDATGAMVQNSKWHVVSPVFTSPDPSPVSENGEPYRRKSMAEGSLIYSNLVEAHPLTIKNQEGPPVICKRSYSVNPRPLDQDPFSVFEKDKTNSHVLNDSSPDLLTPLGAGSIVFSNSWYINGDIGSKPLSYPHFNSDSVDPFDVESVDPKAPLSEAFASQSSSISDQTFPSNTATITATTPEVNTKTNNSNTPTDNPKASLFNGLYLNENSRKRKLSMPVQPSPKTRSFSFSALTSQSQISPSAPNNGLFMLHPRSRNRSISIRRRPSLFNVGPFSDAIQVKIFQYLPLPDLMRFQRVCQQWRQLLLNSPLLLQELDLRRFNTTIDDKSIVSIINFAGQRPKVVDISNCFYLTDDGFSYLVNGIGLAKIQIFKMKSVWEVSGMAIMDLTVPSIGSDLEEIDLSNCRKVNDATLERLIGWITPETSSLSSSSSLNQHHHHLQANDVNNGRTNGGFPCMAPAPGTIVGCCQLKRISLSYCKHITDRSMHHISIYASNRLQSLDLTRCTSITDQGFHYWSFVPGFPQLRKLILADCTFLSDKAIISLIGAAKNLEYLDLSFCCSLSDVSVEVISLGLARLRYLNLSFCGSAVSDHGMNALALHLYELQNLSVRGCVRVTKLGVNKVLEQCVDLKKLDISQCRNSPGWGGLYNSDWQNRVSVVY